jgi:hypothetical protein
MRGSEPFALEVHGEFELKLPDTRPRPSPEGRGRGWEWGSYATADLAGSGVM